METEINWRPIYREVLGEDPNLFPYDYLLGDEAALPSLCESPLMAPISSHDDLSALPEHEAIRSWDEMGDAKGKDGEEEAPPQMVRYGAEKRRACRSRKRDLELTFEVVSQYFAMPITQAAQRLNVGLTQLKKRCRELGIPRWPHRKMKSLQALIQNVQESEGDDEAERRSLIEMLREERTLMQQKPHVQLQEKTKRLRQTYFKANFKKRRLMAPSDDGRNQHGSTPTNIPPSDVMFDYPELHGIPTENPTYNNLLFPSEAAFGRPELSQILSEKPNYGYWAGFYF